MSERFDKAYVIDTNIILDNAESIFDLSQDSNNLIVLPETTLDEVDTKKTGLDEINYQARQFGRILADAEVLETTKVGPNKDITIMRVKVKNAIIDIISKVNYNLSDVDKSILNDRKIIQIALNSTEYYNIPTILISNDIMCRTRAISLGVKTESLLSNTFKVDDLEFHKIICIDNFTSKDILQADFNDIYEIPQHISSLEINLKDGNKFFYFRNKNNLFEKLEDKNVEKFPAPPINMLQKVASNVIYDENDITVIFGAAGCGKNLIALSSAMRLCDTKNYNKIYYMRRTIISGDNDDELGFLPGTLEEKIKGYNYPMEDALAKLAKLKKKNATKDEIVDIVEMYKSKYQIEYLYAGHTRGMNLDENSILILDEAQNNTVNTMRTLISRISKNSIAIVLGSNNQIDTKYLTKNNNGLTALIELSKTNDTISLRVVELKNIIRSKVAEWVDRVL